MTNRALFTLLHISDFHFSKRRQREQGIVVDALIKDLKSLCIGHRKPDLIMFTGDLVHAAGTDLHDEAYDFLIDRVSQVTGCSDERIFIAPGNHDLSWSGLDRFGTDTRNWLSIVGTETETAQFNHLHETRAFDAAVADKFSNYIELERYISNGERLKTRRLANAFVTVDFIPALNADVVVFNTAVLSTGGHKMYAPDAGKLVVPEYAIMEAIEKLTTNSLRVFVTHHPLSWLSEQSSRYLEGVIAKHASLHLFGHMHDPQPKTIVGLKGTVVTDQAGALFTARKEYYNGYSLLTLDRSNGEVETIIRSYFKDRDVFDDGIDVIEGGRWYSSSKGRQHFRTIATPVDEQVLRAHLNGPSLIHLIAREQSLGGDGNLHDRFVSPPLQRTFIEEGSTAEGNVSLEKDIAFDEIIRSDSNLILYAKPEYGRTSLLKEIRFRLLTETTGFPRLPVLFDFGEISSNVDNMLRKAKSGAELPPDGNDIESLLTLGYACVMVDDVQFADVRRMRILRDFVNRFSKARYIFSSPQSSATQLGACINPEMPVRFDFVEIRELRRSDMRQLLAKEQRCTDVEVWLDRLQEEFREINLPFTAANGSILIEILSEKYNFTPINRAVLMEQFVDSTLRKAAIEQSRRETFDYTNKTDLLSHLAAWMAQNDNYVPAREALRSEMSAYINSKGLNASLDDLLSEFLAARIFVTRAESSLSFRYRGVLEYFIALRMTSDPVFKEWVMDDTRYLRYINEIHYYAGKLRNDAALVELVAKRHQTIMENALSDIGKIDLNQLDDIEVPSEKKSDDINSIAQVIGQPPLTQEEKDSELDLEIPRDAENRQEVFRPKADDPGDKVTLSLLLYSGIVKNMELISDTDKRQHLSTVLEGWSTLLVVALRFAPRLAKERKVRINGALYEVQAPHGMNDITLLRQLMVHLPHVHVRMLSHTLGTEKLERQLTEPTLSEQAEPKIYDFFRTSLIADLRLSATPHAIRSLALKLRDNRYLLWSLIVHINHLRRLDRLNEEHFKQLEAPLAEAIANLRGGSFANRQSEKRKQLVRLERDRLLLTMKNSKDR